MTKLAKNHSRSSPLPELRVQLGHFQGIGSVAFSPNGQYVATASRDQTVILWEVETGREVRRFTGHQDAVWSVAFNANGRFLLSGSWDRTARLWDIRNGSEVQRYEGHLDGLDAVTVSPDGRFVLTGSRDAKARLWDLLTGKPLHCFEGHSSTVSAVAFSPDGQLILTASWDGTVRLWRVTGQAELQVFVGDRVAVFSPDGQHVLSSSSEIRGGRWEYGARLWELATQQEVRRFVGHTQCVYSVAFSPTGEAVITGSGDNTARLWDVRSGREIQCFTGHTGWVNSVSFCPSPGTNKILTGSEDATARLWKIGTEREVISYNGYASPVTSIAVSHDGRRLLSGHRDNTAHIWDVKTGRQVHVLRGHTEPVSSVAFSPDGRLALTGSWDQTARLWNTQTGHELSPAFEGHRSIITSVAFSSNGSYVLTGSTPVADRAYDATARLWEVSSRRELRQFPGELGCGVSSVAISPNQRYVVTGSWTGSAFLWELDTESQPRALQQSDGRFESVAFSHDSRYILGAFYGTARIWRVDTCCEVQVFGKGDIRVRSATFSPDGYRVLTGSDDGLARLWRVGQEREEQCFPGHIAAISSVAFLDNDTVVTGSEDATIRVWSAATAEEFVQLIGFSGGDWSVIARGGRFDTNNLEQFTGLHWLMGDDPLRPLPIEIFMRDYYEPRLLSRRLKHEIFKPVRPLTDLNRVQPCVRILSIEPDQPKQDRVKVTVEVSGDEQTYGEDNQKRTWRTGVYDLRLFRDRQLVSMAPRNETQISDTIAGAMHLEQWRTATELTPNSQTGTHRMVFGDISLPRRADVESIEFSAYAFNEDRIKSATARKRCYFTREGTPTRGEACIVQRPNPRKGRAYLIAVGVNAFETESWDLRFAARDAVKFSDVLYHSLMATNDYAEIVSVQLISDWIEGKHSCERTVTSKDATKAKFKAVVDMLAGRAVNSTLLGTIPNANQLQKVWPEDLVIISFSSHGYADQSGTFYLFPYDIGIHTDKRVTSQILLHAISSAELSDWLLAVDAMDLVMIIDACHSAVSVEGSGFKPGPMGASGLGQLAYDKGMRVLASTRAEDVAWESAEIQQGLLSYALVHDGLLERNADFFDPKDNIISLTEWLTYAVNRVPELYDIVLHGEAKGPKGEPVRLTAYSRDIGAYYIFDDQTPARQGVQEPTLFDFRSSQSGEILIAGMAEHLTVKER